MFPDGREVPNRGWPIKRPIWAKLGDASGWADAITFGPHLNNLERAARDFNAIGLDWPEGR